MGASPSAASPLVPGPRTTGAPYSSGRATSLRALTAVALLAGFHLLALGIVLGLLAVDVALYRASDGLRPSLFKIWLCTSLIAYPVVRVVFLTRRRTEHHDLPGLEVTRADQPALWAAVDRVAERSGVRGPATVRLVPDVDAAVREDTRLLGLLPGERHLELGTPLLIGLTEGELEAVLAHEFGHFANHDLRLGAVTVAGRTALRNAVADLHERADRRRAALEAKLAAEAAKRLAKGRGPARKEALDGVDRALAKLFTWYAELYFRVSESASRRQEYAADLVAARVAGRDATAAALRGLPLLDAARELYLDAYLAPGLDAGLLPPPGQVHGGLARLLADPERRRELAALPPDGDADGADPYDSHPPIRLRIAAVEALPDDGRGPGATAPALGLLRDADQVFTELERVSTVPEAAGLERVDWPELAHRSMTARTRADAEPLRTALTGLGLPATLDGALSAIESGRLRELAAAMPLGEEARAATGRAAREFARAALHGPLLALALTTLADTGAARWSLSWSGPAGLHRAEGDDEALARALDALDAAEPDPAPLRALLTPSTAPPVPAAPSTAAVPAPAGP
ncbi:M48 family metalloprotease [Kitasatospora sp. NPDC004240]